MYTRRIFFPKRTFPWWYFIGRIFFLTLFFFITISNANGHITLKPMALVKQDKILVSDIFEGLDKEDNRVVREAPLPGHKIVLPFAQLKDIARKLGIDWKPLAEASILIRRDSYQFPKTDLKKLLRQTLEQVDSTIFDQSDKVDISLDPQNPKIYLPSEKKTNLGVLSAHLSERKNQFTVVLKTPYESFTMNGFIEKSVPIPVLKTTMNRGDIVLEENVELIQMPVKELGRNLIIEAKEIIGHKLSSGRILPFQPIYSHQLVPLSHIQTDEQITLQGSSQGKELSAQGLALEEGHIYDVIRVKVADKEKVVFAQITGPRTAEIQALETPQVENEESTKLLPTP